MSEQKNKTLSTIVLILVLTVAMVMPVINQNLLTTKAQTATLISTNVSQYEWTSPAADPSRSFFSAGPAPNSPSIQWKTKIPNVNGFPVAFNGMIFVADLSKTYALDATTGAIVWTSSVSAGLAGGMGKIDNTYMMIGSTCVLIADGTTVWVGPPGFTYDQSVINGAGYIPELKMFLDNSHGWSLADPSKPPTLVWDRTIQENVGHGYAVYGGGKLFVGAEDGFLRALDAKTGNLLWTTPLTSVFNYGASYVNGMVIQGGLDGNMHAWDANTGKMLWTYNPGTFYNEWASATGAAYGMVYEHNQDTFIYAVNASNGHLVWSAKGPGIGYSNTLSIADGKVYVQMGENQYRDFNTGLFAYSEFDCYDAYTGKLIWSLPVENGAPFNQQCIAYGNLYIIPTITPQQPGVWTYSLGGVNSLGEVWCIGSTPKDWSMFMSDPAHSGEGAGPTNLSLSWKFQTGAAVVSSPTIVDNVCYFGSLDSNIYAVGASTGSKLWSFKTGFEVASSLAVVNGKVYTGADDGNIYCLDATTGSKLWETPAGGVTNNLLGAGTYLSVIPPTRSSPVVVNGKVYVGALDGNLYCLSADSGSVLWKYATNGPILASPTVANNAVYFSSCAGGQAMYINPAPPANGDFYKLDASSGNLIWHNAIPYVLNETFGWGNFLLASATVADGKVFVRNGFLYTYAFDDKNGNTLWTYKGRFNPGTPFQTGGVIQINAPLYAYGVLYMNDYYGITCINANSGNETWFTWLSREDISPALAYSYNRIYAVNELGNMYVLDALTGAKLSFYVFGNQMHSAPSLYNGNVYVGCNDWNVYCFGDARLMTAQSQTGQTTNTPQAQPTNPAQTQVPVAVTPTPNNVASNNLSPTVMYAILGVVVLVIVVAAVALVLRRRK